MTNTPTPPGPIAQSLAQYQSNGHQTLCLQPQPMPQISQKKGGAGFAGKTLWDWLHLLGVFLIPLVIAAASIWFSVQQNATSLQLSDKQHQSDQIIASDQQRSTTLKSYMDDVTGLLLHEGLRESQADAAVRVVARAKTLVALTQLDGERKATLVQFIHEARLIGYYVYQGKEVPSTKIDPVIHLAIANLSGANLRGMNLLGANLNGANLEGVNLNGASLEGAGLEGVNLSRAHLRGVNLFGASLIGTSLIGTEVTPEQLSNAWALKDAILPDGSRYPSTSYPIPNRQESTN